MNKSENDSMLQHPEHEEHEEHSSHDGHEHNAFSDHHEHHRNEIGLAVAPVYFIKEKEVTLGVHFHYVHNVPSSKFGVGYE